MERDIIRAWSLATKIEVNKEIEDNILLFTELIYSSNQLFNITGFKTKDKILTELVLKSVEPLSDIIVPRGTRFVDLGSGAGIPGVVLSMFNRNFSGVLIESNNKKAEFIRNAIERLEMKDIKVVCGRAEAVVSETGLRGSMDWCFARAFQKMFITVELGAPFLKKNGLLYIYSNDLHVELPQQLLIHTRILGLEIMSHDKLKEMKLSVPCVCFKKTESTPAVYPRSFAIIKRESEKIK